MGSKSRLRAGSGIVLGDDLKLTKGQLWHGGDTVLNDASILVNTGVVLMEYVILVTGEIAYDVRSEDCSMWHIINFMTKRKGNQLCHILIHSSNVTNENHDQFPNYPQALV